LFYFLPFSHPADIHSTHLQAVSIFQPISVPTDKKRRKDNLLVTSCVGSAFYDTLLKERLKGIEDNKEDVSSYWMTLKKRKDTVK